MGGSIGRLGGGGGASNVHLPWMAAQQATQAHSVGLGHSLAPLVPAAGRSGRHDRALA